MKRGKGAPLSRECRKVAGRKTRRKGGKKRGGTFQSITEHLPCPRGEEEDRRMTLKDEFERRSGSRPPTWGKKEGGPRFLVDKKGDKQEGAVVKYCGEKKKG